MACQLDPRCRLLCRADLAPKAIMHRMEGGSSVTLGPALDKTAHYNHAPSWHSTWLYGGDTSTPFFILRTGNIVGAGGGGEAISTTWAVLSTRVPVPRYFG